MAPEIGGRNVGLNVDRADDGRRRLLKMMVDATLCAGIVAGLPLTALGRPERAIPESAGDALDVFQIKRVAQQKLPLPVWHFIMNGADDGKTMTANRAVFDEWELRVRRLIDITNIDTSLELLGEKLASPIIVAPIGAQQTIHADGELATARAAAKRKHLMIASMMTNYSFTEIADEGGQAWFQLYASPFEDMMRHMLAQAEAAGSRTLVLTVDSPTRGNREGERWFANAARQPSQRLGNFEGYDGKIRIGDPSMTWDIVAWLRANTSMHIVLKGIVTREDAALSVEHGVDAIIVSNHGGRQEESNRATLDSLIEVLDGADNRLPVLIDGGFRRGTDIFKALALGARAVCIGRPQVWGLGAFGQDGVERVLRILAAELQTVMKFAGTTTLPAIDTSALSRRIR